MPTVLDLAEQFNKAIAAHDAKALQRIVNMYGGMRSDLQDRVDSLLLYARDHELTRTQLYNSSRYKELLRQVETEMEKFSRWLEPELAQAAREAIGKGSRDAEALTNAVIDPSGEVTIRFTRLPTRAIQNLLGFLDKDGPLYGRLSNLGAAQRDAIGKTLLNAIGQGWNPRKTAKLITRDMGRGLTDAMRMARTVQLYSYREASRASFIANDNVVSGWYWFAHTMRGTCLSCIAQHGTFHENTERLNDHYNGRCVAIPAVRGFDSPIERGGEDWFRQLPESEQRQFMGKQIYGLWKDGRFDFNRLSREQPDEVYGPMRSVTSIRDLVK